MPPELSDQEKASLLEGERIESQENARDADVYAKAREDSESELAFAGKFRTAEDLEKAYLELQKKLGEPKDKEEDSEEEETQEPAEEVEEASEEQEEATEEEVEEEPGPRFSEEDVEAIFDHVGGEKVYQAALDWAAEALTEQEQEEFNTVLEEATSPTVAKFAVEALVNRYKANADFQGQQVRGRRAGTDGVKPFRSREEVNTAMQDPRYDRDPAYRNDVADRLAASADDLL